MLMNSMHKTCPACRKHSDLVIPSRTFYAHGTPGKEQVKARYLLNLSQKPCKHFSRSAPHRRWCPFGNECRFSHQVNGTRYIFSPFELERIRQERERSTIQRDAQTILGNVMMDARFLLDEQEAYVWDLIHGMIDDEDDMRERQPYEDLFGRPLFDFREAFERELGIFDDDDDDERDFDSEEDDEDDEDESIPDLVEDVGSDDDASDDDDGLPALVSDSEEMPTLVSDSEEMPTLVSDSEEMPALVSDSEEMPALVSDDENLPELISDPADDPDLSDLPDLIPDAWTREDWGPSHVDNTDTRPQVVISNTNSPTPRPQTSNPRATFTPRVIPNRRNPSDSLPQSPFADISSPRILFPITVSLPNFLPPRPTQQPLFPPTHSQHALPRTSQPSLRNTFGAPPAQSQRRFSHPQHTPPPGRRRPHPPRSRAPDFRQPQQFASRRARQPARPPPDPLSAWVDDDAGSATTDGETSERERQRTGEDRGINGLRWDSRANDLSFFDS
jgi:hypothetical protein